MSFQCESSSTYMSLFTDLTTRACTFAHVQYDHHIRAISKSDAEYQIGLKEVFGEDCAALSKQ